MLVVLHGSFWLRKLTSASVVIKCGTVREIELISHVRFTFQERRLAFIFI